MALSDHQEFRLEPKNIDIVVPMPRKKVTSPINALSNKNSETVQNEFKEFTIEEKKKIMKSNSQLNSPRSLDLDQQFEMPYKETLKPEQRDI